MIRQYEPSLSSFLFPLLAFVPLPYFSIPLLSCRYLGLNSPSFLPAPLSTASFANTSFAALSFLLKETKWNSCCEQIGN